LSFYNVLLLGKLALAVPMILPVTQHFSIAWFVRRLSRSCSALTVWQI